MSKLVPLGPRLLCEEIVPVSDIEERAKNAGLVLAQFENSRPKPTTGKVVALGTDPELNEHIKVGDTVYFDKHAGSITTIEGKQYRSLEFHEITSVLKVRLPSTSVASAITLFEPAWKVPPIAVPAAAACRSVWSIECLRRKRCSRRREATSSGSVRPPRPRRSQPVSVWFTTI